MLLDTTDLDAQATLRLAEANVSLRREAEVNDLLLVLHTCDLNSAPPTVKRPGGERLELLGGDGTPEVRDLPLLEMGIARGVHHLAVRCAAADALDLRHRLPLIWAEVLALKAEPWVARKVAFLSRSLDRDQAGLVDRKVSAAITGQAPSRVLEIAEAAVAEADPVGHEARVAEQQRRRFVAFGRISAEGLRTVVARVSAGDAMWIEATVDRVTEILTLGAHYAGYSRDELRSIAFGYLGRPAELLALLLAHTVTDDDQANQDWEHDPHPDGRTGPGGHTDADTRRPYLDPDDIPSRRRTSTADGVADTAPTPVDDEPGEPAEPEPDTIPDAPDLGPDPQPADDDAPSDESAEPATEPDGYGPCRPLAFPADLLGALRGIDPRELRPRGVLYAHLHEAVLEGIVDGVARVEGLGPHSMAMLHELLRSMHVEVRPVIDLNEEISVNAYEHPDRIRERVHLRRPGDQFPHGSYLGRNVDLDHPIPYDPHGPPGQTSTHTANPLRRTGHRAKTHLGYTVTPLPDGSHLWRTPHGLERIVDHTGTHDLPEAVAPVGAAVYFPAFDLDYDAA